MAQDVLQVPQALKSSTKRRLPDGWALLTCKGETAAFHPRVRSFFGATLGDDGPKFDSDALARQDRENPVDAPHRCVEVFFAGDPATPAYASRGEEVSATIEELGQPAFWGFEDADACCVHMNFTPCGARAGGEYAKAYYSADQVRALLR